MSRSLDLAVVVTLQDKLSAGLGGLVGRVTKLGAAVGTLAAIGAGAGLAAVAGKMVSVNAEFEKYETILKTLTGSSAKAKEAMNWVSEFAAKTPYELSETTDAFVKLSSYGINPMSGSLKAAGDAAAAMGKPLSQAVEALADAMTGENERLKEFGITAKKKGDKIRYSWTENGKQMAADANANSKKQIQAVIEGIWNRRFGGAMSELSRTWSGMLSNLGDAWSRFFLNIGKAGAFDSIKGALGELNAWFERQNASGAAGRWASDLSAAITRVVEGLKDIVFGARTIEDGLTKRSRSGGLLDQLPSIIDSIRNGIVDFAKGAASLYESLKPATDLLGGPFYAALALIAGLQILSIANSIAALANPIGAVILAITAIGIGAKLLYDNWEPVKAWFTALWDDIVAAVKAVPGQLAEAGAAMIQAIWDGAKAKFVEMLDWIKSIPSAIGSAITAPTIGTPGGAPEFSDIERSRRADAAFRRDPEAARGRAMSAVRPSEKATVSGEITVKVEGPGTVTATSSTPGVTIQPDRGQSVLRP